MISKFYEPVIKVLAANAPKAMKVSEILHQIVETVPGIGWGMESSGAVRAMLLRATEAGGYSILRTPDSQPPTFVFTPVEKRSGSATKTGFECKSILYKPALECLKATAPKAVGAKDVLRYINENFPNLSWSHSSGPVRAMLLHVAGKPGSGVSLVPGSVPPAFVYDGKLGGQKERPITDEGNAPVASPEEQMQTSFDELQEELKERLLSVVQKMDDYEFERLINELISRLGYGQAKTTQQSGDKGIDGLIYGDKLGLRVIRVQAKHFAVGNPVGAPLVRAFIGALQGDDGVFVTTSTFTKDAYDAVKNAHTNSKIALMNGNQLVSHMIECNFGVQPTGVVYTLKKVDVDFFAEYGVEIKIP